MQTHRERKNRRLRSGVVFVLLILAALFLAACGGSGGSSSSDGAGGIGGTGATFGRITGFGSVIIDGDEIETVAETEYEVEGRDNQESELEVGMVVDVDFEDRSGVRTATRIEFRDNVEGPIDAGSINTVDSSFIVLGQKVFAGDANFEGATFDTLVDGNLVEVSGFVDANGNIQATRVERKANAFTPGVDEIEVKGTLSNLDTADQTFMINALVVDYSGAVIDDSLDADGVLDAGDVGKFVEVKSIDGFNLQDQLIASQVELEDDIFEFEEEDEAEIEGFITSFTDSNTFEVSGQRVDASGAVFEGGTRDDLGLNVKVGVEGPINADGVLAARKVEVKRAQSIKIEADVDADPNLTTGTVTFFGGAITVGTDVATEFDDKRDDERPFGLANISQGDRLEVRASQTGADIIASRLEREDDDDEVLLQGVVDSSNEGADTLVILGVTVNTAGAQFEDRNDQPISASAFFGQLTAGATVVKAKGTVNASDEIDADELELESDD